VKFAQKLRRAADALQPKIDAKRDSGVSRQSLTARRARIADGMRADALRLEAVQRVLRHLADLHEHGSVPPVLAKITSAAAAERVQVWANQGRIPDADGWCAAERQKLVRLGIDSVSNLREAWSLLAAPWDAKRPPTREEKQRTLERELVGVSFPGFFPTPASLADRLCRMADLEDHHRVLEPSAGKGDLVEAIFRAAPGAKVVAIERAYRLVELLKVRFEGRAVTVIGTDFIEDPESLPPHFDRVVMNPPFERHVDRAHVLRALRYLRQDGVLVAIMGGMAIDARGGDAFREALDDLTDWEVEPLPAGSFQGAAAFRQTGVSSLVLRAVRR
jgi:protein-L-isoaspartate O-methyltransferase